MPRSRLAAIGSLLANDTRAELLIGLMDGRSYTGAELARHLGVGRSTVSEHLSMLLEAGMVAIEAQGRHRYFRLAGEEIAELLETIGGSAAAQRTTLAPHTPSGLAFARSCYDHLAGELAVAIYDRLSKDGHLRDTDRQIQLTPSGSELLRSLGVPDDSLIEGRRPVTRRCLDWTERRHHLAGAAGAALFSALLTRGWVVRGRKPRVIRLTAEGRAGITEHLGVRAVG